MSDIEIIPFRDEHRAAFSVLNRSWLEEHGLYELPDELQLADPRAEILAHGGAIFIAVRGADVVGTAAVVAHGPRDVELAKLTVAESARGSGLGRRLVEHCITHARNSSVQRMVLVSSTKLAAALRLYERLGFIHRPLPATVPYTTADVYMELDLQAERSTANQ